MSITRPNTTGYFLPMTEPTAANEHAPGGYSLTAPLTAEIVMTFMFLTIILSATDSRASQGFAPLAIGLGRMR